jgi:hypothetical protein
LGFGPCGFESRPRHRLDPLTGISRRTALLLAAILVAGITASTVATIIEARGDPGCPRKAYGCTEIRPGQPIRLGLLTVGPGGADAAAEVKAVLQARGANMLGHRVVIAHRGGDCTAEAGAEAARDLTEPSAETPHLVGTVGVACSRAMTPAAQILGDSGQVLITAADTPPPDTARETGFYLGADGAGEAAEAILEAVSRVALWNGNNLLIPRTDLRDSLLEAGLRPAS